MPCLMSPKSSIQVQLKPMENHSTGMLMKVMEIPRARISLREHRRPPCYTILLSINKTSACITGEHSDQRAAASTPGEPFHTSANVLLDGAGRLNLGLLLAGFYTQRECRDTQVSISERLRRTAELLQSFAKAGETSGTRPVWCSLSTQAVVEHKQAGGGKTVLKGRGKQWLRVIPSPFTRAKPHSTGMQGTRPEQQRHTRGQRARQRARGRRQKAPEESRSLETRAATLQGIETLL